MPASLETSLTRRRHVALHLRLIADRLEIGDRGVETRSIPGQDRDLGSRPCCVWRSAARVEVGVGYRERVSVCVSKADRAQDLRSSEQALGALGLRQRSSEKLLVKRLAGIGADRYSH